MKYFIPLIFALILLSCQKQELKQPNVIIFLSDDMRDVDVSPYGRQQPTPTIQELANEGAIFNNAYCSSSMCTPSRYTLLTGSYAGRCQAKKFLKNNPYSEPYTVAWNTHLSEEDNTIAEYLNKAGYFTGYVGKYHLGGDDLRASFPHFNGEVDPYDPEVDAKLKSYQSDLQQYIKDVAGFDYAASVLWANYERNPLADQCFHNFEWMTEGAVDFLEEAGDQPFFLYSATTALHGPPHDKALDLDARVTPGGLLEDPAKYHPSRKELKNRLQQNGFEISHHNVGLAMLDDHVGAVLNKLEELGKSENTLVIFLSDHGVEPGKASNYEVGLKIPMIARWPSVIKKGSKLDQNIQIVDLLPTVLAAAGTPLPEGQVDGISFYGPLKGEEHTGRKYLYFENGYSRAISDGTYKYITLRYPERIIKGMQDGNYEHAPNHLDFPMQPNAQVAIEYHPHYFDQEQLYNYMEDYWEQENLIGEEKLAGKAQELREQLRVQTAAFDHPYPMNNQDFLETDAFKALAKKSYDLDTDYIYWWNPAERELPPEY